MAKVSIGHRPDLTSEELLSVFQRGLGDKYQMVWKPISVGAGPFAQKWDFFIRKNALVGVRVGLNQEGNDTVVAFAGSAPSVWGNVVIMTFLGLPALFLYNSLMNEVRAFITASGELGARTS